MRALLESFMTDSVTKTRANRGPFPRCESTKKLQIESGVGGWTLKRQKSKKKTFYEKRKDIETIAVQKIEVMVLKLINQKTAILSCVYPVSDSCIKNI